MNDALFVVVCFGTEDREAEKSVAASDSVLAFVSFPGNEIKDLYVHEPNQDTPEEDISSKNESLPPPPNKSSSSSENRVRTDTNRTVQRSEHSGRGERAKRTGGRGRGGPTTAAGTGEHLLRLRERTGQNGQTTGHTPVKPEGEFDFESGLTSFKVCGYLIYLNCTEEIAQKAEVLAEVAEEQTKDGRSMEACYNKDNFFDTLSCAALDGDGGRKTRLTPSEERSLNQDTFGAIALQQNNYRRGGYRGGRGGGRGGYGRGGNYQRQQGQGGYNRRRGGGGNGYSQGQQRYGGRGGQSDRKPADQAAS